MTMSPQRGLEEQLKEAGTKLLDPPTPVDELLGLLDHVENLLSKVEQSPAKSIQEAISPITSAVVLDVLLRHSNVDVKVAVASCISEITRISAPEAPYDDDKMKDVFELIVSAFVGLSDESSRSYNKRVMILVTVAQVRSCVVMLDLECDGMIVEMFKIFLSTIRDYHPENVFSSMETIMALVLEESEDISSEILAPLLACLKKGNQEILPVAVKLAEKVFENCAAIVKPYLTEARKSLEDYNDVVAAVCGGPSATVEATNENASTNPLVQKYVGEAISMDADENVSGRPNSVKSNGVCDNGKENLGMGVKEESSVHAIEKGQDNPSADKLASKSEDDESETQKPLKVKSKMKGANTIRGGKPNSSMIASESSDTSHFDSENEVENQSDAQEKDSYESSREVDAVVVSKKPSLDLTSKKASKGKCDSDAKLRRSGEKATLTKKDKTSIDVDTSKKENKGMGDSGKKQMKQLGKRMVESSNTIDESSESKRRRKTKPASAKEATKTSAEDLKKTPSTKSSSKLSKESRSPEETPGMSSKRKHDASQQKATENKLDGSLVGTKVKVWWPDDKQFYEGVIHSYDSTKKKHKVLYNDGEEETLFLKKERWHIIDDDLISSEKQAAETTSPEAASGSQKRAKAKTNPKSLVKPEKSIVSLKSSAASSRKAKGANTKHGHEGDEELEMEDRIQKSGGKRDDGNVIRSKSHAQRSGDKRVDNSPKPSPMTSSKSKQDSAKLGVKSTTKARQAGDDSNAGKIKNKGKVADVAKTSGGKVKLPDMSKVQETEGSTKKRHRAG